MKNFQIVEGKTMDILKEELFKLSKVLDETRGNKFINEIDTFSVVYNPKSDVFQAMVMISYRFNRNYTPEEKSNQSSFKEKDNKFRANKSNNKKGEDIKSNNKKGEDMVSKFFKDDNISSEAKERMYQKQKRKGKFNK